MNTYTEVIANNHKRVVYCENDKVGLKAWIAVHNTNLGPALGGTRMWNYESYNVGLTDALRLSKGMSYKNAMANLSLGGGKGVIWGDARKDKTEELLRAYAEFVEYMGGDYLTAEDVGLKVTDIEFIKQITQHAYGLPNGSGNPAPHTACGVYAGIKSAVNYKLPNKDLDRLVVAVQGVGQVGYHLCKLLHEDGIILYVSDINQEALDRVVNDFGATVVTDIHKVDADVFSPCALGAILNPTTIPEMNCSIVAGSANNQLLTNADGEALRDANILYAPDYVINAGGVIAIAYEYRDNGYDGLERDIDKIGETLTEVYRRAEAEGVPTNIIADKIAEERMTTTN